MSSTSKSKTSSKTHRKLSQGKTGNHDPTSKMTLNNQSKLSVPASTSNDVATPPRNNPDIETYYRSRGLSYSHVRQMNRNYVNYDGPGGEASRGIVFWDSFSPPPGYSVDDLPSSDSMILSQPKEEAVSPAILAAARYKRKPPRPAMGTASSEDDFNDLIKKLTKHKRTAAAATAEKENAIQSAKKSSPAFSTTPLEPVVELELSQSNNNSFSSMEFPEFEEGLNDSALIRCTQAAEKEFEEEKNRENNQFKILDLIDPLSAGKFNIKQKTTELKGQLTEPMASTPLNGGIQSVLRRSSRSKNGTGNSSAVSATSASSSASFFESSTVESESAKSTLSLRRSQRTTVPRTLFSSSNQMESPIKSSDNKVGDFEDDDDDDLFSQIDIPYVENGNGGNCKGIREACDQSTLIISEIDESDDLLDNADFLTQITKEGMAPQNKNLGRKKVEDLLTQVCNPDCTTVKESPQLPNKRTPSKRLKAKHGPR